VTALLRARTMKAAFNELEEPSMSPIVRRRRFLRWRIPRAALALAAVGAALAVPTTAVAGGPQEICVHVACPPGIPSVGDNLQAAFALASASGVPSKILLGDKGSPYDGVFTYTPGRGRSRR
jgi:hypothetical protein